MPRFFGWLVLLLAVGLAVPADAQSVKKLKKDVKKAVQAGEYDMAIDTISEIAGIGGEDAIEALYEIGTKYGVTEKLYRAVIKELVAIDGGLDYVVAEGEKAKGNDAVFVGDICSEVSDKEEKARTVLIAMLEEKSPIIRGVAVQGLERSENHDAIEPLIDLLEQLSKSRRKDVLYYQVRDALFNLTYQDFDLLDDWRNWWAPNKGTFDPKKLDEKGKTGVTRKKRGEDADFFGVPITSKHVVFVIDNSGSMKYVHKDDIPGLARGDGSDSGQGKGGGQMSPEDSRLAKFWTRMEMAKRELRKALSTIKSDTMFNVVTFNTESATFKKKAIPASPGNKKAALKFVDTIRFVDHGNTNTKQALIDAFKADRKTNTIYFLSDGLPSIDGKVNDPTQPIMDTVFRLNRFRKIKINTFGFYPKTQSNQPMPALEAANEFLKQLANSTGGKFTPMKVDNNLRPPSP